MKSNRYHVISKSGQWAIKKEGARRAAGVYSTKSQATQESQKFRSQNNDVVVHKRDGTISEWQKAK